MAECLYDIILLDTTASTCIYVYIHTGYMRRIRQVATHDEVGPQSQSRSQKLYNEVDHGQEKPNLVHVLIEAIIWPFKELHQ